MYKISRYWNRLAYLVIRTGMKMIWDNTGRNYLGIEDMVDAIQSTEDILCGR